VSTKIKNPNYMILSRCSLYYFDAIEFFFNKFFRFQDLNSKNYKNRVYLLNHTEKTIC